MSQLALALEADVSQRHLSFVESGRSRPSREMTLRLAEHLSVPLRDRNVLLVAAGYAPVYPERPLDDPDLQAARHTVELILKGYAPYPAIAIDRHWNLEMANAAALRLMRGVAPELLEPPVNVLRVSLNPDGLAPRIRNYREWRAHVLDRLHRQVGDTADAVLAELVDELAAYPVPSGAAFRTPGEKPPFAGIAVPLELDTPSGPLNFLSTTTVFGTALEVSLAELAIESFLPADEATAAACARLAS